MTRYFIIFEIARFISGGRAGEELLRRFRTALDGWSRAVPAWNPGVIGRGYRTVCDVLK